MKLLNSSISLALSCIRSIELFKKRSSLTEIVVSALNARAIASLGLAYNETLPWSPRIIISAK